MKLKVSPILAVLFISGLSACLSPAWAQLPPTNLGRFVHQPGDNQYSPEVQASRHVSTQQPVTQGAVAPMMRSQTQNVPAVDISIEPIACDEPIPESGFPPLPDRLDLPVSNTAGSWTSGNNGNAGYSRVHQHYAHVSVPGMTGQSEGGPGYYKVKGSDIYNSNNSGRTSTNNPGSPPPAPPKPPPPAPEPKLGEGTHSLEPPQAVTVNQSTTQDLSLPDDDFSYQYKPTTHPIKNAVRDLRNVIRTVPANAAMMRY